MQINTARLFYTYKYIFFKTGPYCTNYFTICFSFNNVL